MATLSNDIVHRDIKPGNVLAFRKPLPDPGILYKFADLGISISLAGSGATTTTAALGTQLYISELFRIKLLEGKDMTNEQLLAEDVFNLGVTFLQYVCSLSENELIWVRSGSSDAIEGRLSFLEELEDKISNARTKRFDEFAIAVIERLNCDVPKGCRMFIGKMLKYRFEERTAPADLLEEYFALKRNPQDEEEEKEEEQK